MIGLFSLVLSALPRFGVGQSARGFGKGRSLLCQPAAMSARTRTVPHCFLTGTEVVERRP